MKQFIDEINSATFQCSSKDIFAESMFCWGGRHNRGQLQGLAFQLKMNLDRQDYRRDVLISSRRFVSKT